MAEELKQSFTEIQYKEFLKETEDKQERIINVDSLLFSMLLQFLQNVASDTNNKNLCCKHWTVQTKAKISKQNIDSCVYAKRQEFATLESHKWNKGESTANKIISLAKTYKHCVITQNKVVGRCIENEAEADEQQLKAALKKKIKMSRIIDR